MMILLSEWTGVVVTDRQIRGWGVEDGRVTIDLIGVPDRIVFGSWLGADVLAMRDSQYMAGRSIVPFVVSRTDVNAYRPTPDWRLHGRVQVKDSPLRAEFFPSRHDYFDCDWWLRAADWYTDHDAPVADAMRSVGEQLSRIHERLLAGE